MIEQKTPDEMADEEINKMIGKALASRKLEIRKLKSQIKELEKEIEKIKTGELVPDKDGYSPSHSQPTQGGMIYIPYQYKPEIKKYKRWDYTDYTYNIWYTTTSDTTTSCSWNE